MGICILIVPCLERKCKEIFLPIDVSVDEPFILWINHISLYLNLKIFRTKDKNISYFFQLRYLQTLNSISAEHNSTIIFPMPMTLPSMAWISSSPSLSTLYAMLTLIVILVVTEKIYRRFAGASEDSSSNLFGHDRASNVNVN